MTGKNGRFEQGRWVEDSGEKAIPPESDAIEKRLIEATRSAVASIDDVMCAAHDLVTTREGQQYIEKTVMDAREQVKRSLDDAFSRIRDEMDKQMKKTQ